MNTGSIVFLASSAFIAAAAATGGLTQLLSKGGILAHPSSRGSHQVPTPVGGGIAIYVVLVTAWGAIALTEPAAPDEMGWILLCSLALAIPSWMDDLTGLPWVPRLILQIVTASIGTILLNAPLPVFQGLLPYALDLPATVFLWVGFVNLFNFTDGIDGNAGTKATALGVGMFLLALLGAIPVVLGELGLTAAAAAAGFLLWNWHPARIFMGDVGSVPLGFLFAWLLLSMAGHGQWAPAVILPLVYLSDTGLTYLVKIARRERFWYTHKDHYYQRAVTRDGITHAQVVKVVLVGDVMMIIMALLSTQGFLWWALLGAALASVAVLAYLDLGLKGLPES
jgi:UDP-N-acetylmuramyl pentapeptide phosphotransferase/UDP-N-acetylglucosamine-1-phosphate transferase